MAMKGYTVDADPRGMIPISFHSLEYKNSNCDCERTVWGEDETHGPALRVYSHLPTAFNDKFVVLFRTGIVDQKNSKAITNLFFQKMNHTYGTVQVLIVELMKKMNHEYDKNRLSQFFVRNNRDRSTIDRRRGIASTY